MSASFPRIARPASGLLVIDGATVEDLVSPSEALPLVEDALRKTSSGVAQQDVRRTLGLPGEAGTCLSLMYASLADRPHFGAKVQSVFPKNFERQMPSHQGGVILFDAETGRPVALINATAITGLRTPAATAVATRTLSRPESCELAILGYGEQAERHIASIALVRPISRIRVWGRDFHKAETFANAQREKGHQIDPMPTAQAAVEGADIVCTVTSAQLPVLQGAWLAPGAHVNAVGASVPALREIDLDCVTRARIWVDYMPMALTAAADIFEPLSAGLIDRARIVGEIGAVLNGQAPGRGDDQEISLYRSLGVPAQDIEFANLVYRRARELGRGVEISL